MAKFLVYADLQATNGHERCFNNPTKSLQLWRVEKFYEDLHRIYTEFQCDGLWDAGDTMDDRSSIPVPAIDAVFTGLERFRTDGFHLKIIGNHEQYLRDSSIDVGKMFTSFFRVSSSLEVIEADGVNILLCSFLEDTDRITKFIHFQTRKKKDSILLGHFQIAGCEMPTGTALMGVPVDGMETVQLGLLGHIHRPQSFGRIHYVGSPFQQHWGEANEEKRVAIVDTDPIGVTWVPMTGYPMYRTVTLAQFQQLCSPESEDRFKVILTSPAETEDFFTHPLSNRAETIYDYDSVLSVSSEAGATVIPRTKQDILREYVRRNPPRDRNIVFDDNAMLAYADKIITAED